MVRCSTSRSSGTSGSAGGTSMRTPPISPTPSTERMAPVGDGPATPRSIASTTRGPNTMPSSSELEARRLAPCTPLHATSPATQSPGSVVAPSRSATTPPQL
jgi:hypothetical protein